MTKAYGQRREIVKVENENVGLGYQNGIVFSEGPVLDLAVLERIQKACSELKLPDGFAPTDAAIRTTYELVDSGRQE